MTVKPLFQKIEIGFWDFIILQMNRSAFLRFAIPRIYRTVHSRQFRQDLMLTLGFAMLGLVSGFGIGILAQL